MRTGDLVIVALAHVAAFAVAAAAVLATDFMGGDLGVAFVAAAVVGTNAGAILHWRANRDSAPPASFGAKALVGGLMAFLCLAEGVFAHFCWHRMAYPDVTIAISALGTLGFPFVLFGAIQRGMANASAKAKKGP